MRNIGESAGICAAKSTRPAEPAAWRRTRGGPAPTTSYPMSRPFAVIVGMAAMLLLRLALDLRRRGPFDAQVVAPVVEQRHRMATLVDDRVDAADEQVVIARRERLDDCAFEGRDGAI